MKQTLRISSCCLGLLALLMPQHAAAQSCHAPSLRATDGLTYRVALSSTLASYQRADTRGEYQSLMPVLSVSHPWLAAELALPMYRLTQNQYTMHGVGDLSAAIRGTAYRSDRGDFSWGPELAATLPTGNADKQLGMGHVMLMPGGWLALRQGKLSILAQLAYSRALASLSMDAHHAGMAMSTVNPMSMSEIEHALGAAYALHPNLQLIARLLGAVPVHSPGGEAREVIAAGLQAIAGPFDASLELQLPVVGSPFDARSVLAVALQW